MAVRISLESIQKFEIELPDDSIKSLYIDYIRVYQPTHTNVIQAISIPKKLKKDMGDNISVRYYPEIKYEWSSPAFHFVPKELDILSHYFCEMQWIYPQANIDVGIYPVYLKTTLPNGNVENHVWQIQVE